MARHRLTVALALAGITALAGCRDTAQPAQPPDAGGPAIDAAPTDGIAEAVAAADGDGLALAIKSATVTYLKPQIGSSDTDPVGFTIQATRTGAALMIAIDPAIQDPPAQVGDVVSFTIIGKQTVQGEPRANAITNYTRTATGTDVSALAQDLSTATDVVSNVAHYDSQLVTISGSVLSPLTTGGTGFQDGTISSAGIAHDPGFQVRVPTTVMSAIDMVASCQFTATQVPMDRFGDQAQVGAYRASDLVLHGCPAPIVEGVIATSPTSLALSLSRNIQPSTVDPSGAQFTFGAGLTATGATVSGRTITLTTSNQAADAAYTLAIAKTVTDLQGSPVSTTSSAFAGYGSTSTSGGGAALSVHTTLGIPGPITTAAPSDNFLSVKQQYVVSYNGTRKVPNWVSWELNTSYLGSTDRANDYRPDDTFPANEPQASLADYSGSGFERGHMCPSADRTLSTATNMITFYLTNMVPQAGNNNEGPWANLEDYARALADDGDELFIISGGTYSATSKTVGSGMSVPDNTFKVIVVLDHVGQGAADVTTSTRVIAVVMPNDNALISKAADWHDYRVSVRTIEAMTGLNFLSDVSQPVQDVIENQVDNLP